MEVGSLTCCSVLVAEHLATIHNGASRTLVAWATAVVVTSVVAVAVSRTAPPMVGPVLLALLAPGLLHADTPRLAVLGFALAALLPVTVVAALGFRSRSAVFRAVAFASVAAILARHLFRDPFRERRCLPACVTNPDLITRAPDVVRVSEIVLAVVSLAVVPIAARRVWTTRRSGAVAVASLALCGLLAVWAVRLLQEPRPVPDDNTDRVVFAVEVAAVVLAATAHGWASVDVVLTRQRIRRFTRTLSDAGDLPAITARIRTAVGEPDLEVELGEDAGHVRPAAASTAVVRGGRTVATIHHRPASRGRVAAAVTPSIALALETQLILSDANAQVVELERSRAASVRVTDESRRSLERNLHDGAQQRLLVVGMQLANASDEGPVGSQRRSAACLVADALQRAAADRSRRCGDHRRARACGCGDVARRFVRPPGADADARLRRSRSRLLAAHAGDHCVSSAGGRNRRGTAGRGDRIERCVPLLRRRPGPHGFDRARRCSGRRPFVATRPRTRRRRADRRQ